MYIVCLVLATKLGVLGDVSGGALGLALLALIVTSVLYYSVATISFSSIFCVLVYNTIKLIIFFLQGVQGKSKGGS